MGRSTKKDFVWNINASCRYCKSIHNVELAPGTKANTILIPCYKCWLKYEKNPLPIPEELKTCKTKFEANTILKKIWLDTDIPESDFRYFKEWITTNFENCQDAANE